MIHHGLTTHTEGVDSAETKQVQKILSDAAEAIYALGLDFDLVFNVAGDHR